MKKFLRFIGILLVLLVAGYLVLCAVSDKETVVEKSIEIDASEAVVWTAMSDFNHWDKWNPWKEADPTVTSTVTGPAGQVGNKSSWVSKESGSGEMTIASIEGHEMKYDMHFITPFESESNGWVKTETKDGKTIATWGFRTEATSFFQKGFMSLFMKPALEKSFTRGTELLKEYTESGEITVSSFNIQETVFPATTYASVRGTVKFADMSTYFQESYGKIFGTAGDRINKDRPAAALYYKWDQENEQSECAPAFAVTEGNDIKGLDMARIAESPAYMIRYQGGYSGSYNAHMALGEHLGKSGKELDVVIEEYVVSPDQETDSSKYVTNIYYLTK